MYLKYAGMLMNKKGDKIYCAHFSFRVFYIGFALSRLLRRLKFETDGTFNVILIEVEDIQFPVTDIFNECDMKALRVRIPFDFKRYDSENESERNQYCIDLFKRALITASALKPIPLFELLNCLEQLEINKFQYNWDFKNISIKDCELKIKFTCQLNSKEYKLNAKVFRAYEKEPICGGTVIRTIPDSSFFGSILKNISVKDGSIRIYAICSTTEFFYIPIQNLCEGKFIVEKSKPYNLNNQRSVETFISNQRSFQYDNDEFR